MKKISLTRLLCLAATTLVSGSIQSDCSSNCSTNCSTSTSNVVLQHLSPRSTSVNLARQFVGVLPIIEELTCSDECYPGFISATLEFDKTFNALDISHKLLGPALMSNGCCQAIEVSGSAVTDRSSTALLAENFGLAPNFHSVVNIDPRVTNAVGDLQGYFRLDSLLHGLYFYIHAPITNTKWNMHVCENIGNTGGADYAAGTFGPGTISNSNLLHSFTEYISGQGTPTLTGTTPLGATFTETFNALEYARWAVGPCDSRSRTGLADLRMWLGYDWLNCEKYGIGMGLVVAAPTGNKPDGRYIFDAVVGNGHFWEVGALIKGDYIFWENCDGDHSLTGFTQANFTHLFGSKQRRTFDLKDKPLSRYMLAARFQNNSSAPFLYGDPTEGSTASPTLSDYVFAGEYTPVANLTTFCVNVSNNIQIDWIAMLNYQRCNLSIDLGYELWYRGCEKVKFNCTANAIAANSWALKGDASMFGFTDASIGTIPQGTPVPLGATESGATVFAGTNAGQTDPTTNPGIDNPQYAIASNLNASPVLFEAVIDNTTNQLQTRTSIQSVFLTGDDIDICGAQSRGLSNKIFANVCFNFNSYAWNCVCWQPFLGAGAMGEFSSSRRGCNSDCRTSSSCNESTCRNSAFSQWGIWIKGGFVF